MSSLKKASKTNISMNAVDVIYHRRAVRDYLPQKIDQDVIHALLDAAVQAPTAMHEEPWSFIVIQDKDLLEELSQSIKSLMTQETTNTKLSQSFLDLVNEPDFRVFYNASTLIVIYSKLQGSFVAADCWLAAENLMLAACAQGLGTCIIGFAVPTLNTLEWKKKLGVPEHMTAIVPVIVGFPANEVPVVSRREPEILAWK